MKYLNEACPTIMKNEFTGFHVQLAPHHDSQDLSFIPAMKIMLVSPHSRQMAEDIKTSLGAITGIDIFETISTEICIHAKPKPGHNAIHVYLSALEAFWKANYVSQSQFAQAKHRLPGAIAFTSHQLRDNLVWQ